MAVQGVDEIALAGTFADSTPKGSLPSLPHTEALPAGREAFATLLAAVDNLIRATPLLRDFVAWNADMPFADLPLIEAPAIPLVKMINAAETPETAPLVAAVRAAAGYAFWQHTYTEAEVGRDFLDQYGWFELVGPGGHFHSTENRIYLAFWGANLHYPSHLHEAEELYYIISGGALFHADGLPSEVLAPGHSRHHLSNQPHAMDTHSEPVLALILWRGSGLNGAARMN